MGISYYYYQCKNPKCSMVTYPLSQLQKLQDYAEEHQFMFLEDWILALFYALPDSPISGRTCLQKEIFLLMVEFAQEEHIPTENIGFYGYDYGPYDDRITEALDEMIESELLAKIGRKGTSKELIYLTPSGKERARESFEILTPEQRNKIVALRREYQQWGREGLLRYVYTNYPDYTHESKIRKQILKTRK